MEEALRPPPEGSGGDERDDAVEGADKVSVDGGSDESLPELERPEEVGAEDGDAGEAMDRDGMRKVSKLAGSSEVGTEGVNSVTDEDTEGSGGETEDERGIVTGDEGEIEGATGGRVAEGAGGVEGSAGEDRAD